MTRGHSQLLSAMAINDFLLQGLSPETRFDYYRLTRSENALLRAIWKLSQDGNCSKAIPKIAQHARLSRKTAQRLLHGYHGQNREWKTGLMTRGIVKQLSPAN